jgi:hypothetical protein
LLAPSKKQLAKDKASVRKHEMVRDVVERLNESAILPSGCAAN